jgi:hypothetical protein
LKEKAGIASSVEAARKAAVGDGEHVTVERSAHVEQPETVAEVEMEAMELRKRNVESTREALACEPRREGVEAGAECEEAIRKSEDVISDAAAKGSVAGKSSRRRGEGILEIDVCSNSSENVSSGLSDEGCAVSGKGGPVVVQGSGIIGVAGVVDEGSGIGKCCSSDDADMGVGRNPNALSVVEDPSKVVGSEERRNEGQQEH